MDMFIMMKAGGTKRHLVIIMESAYESRTLQQIGNLVCDSCQVTMWQVDIDNMDVYTEQDVDLHEIDIVDDYGVNRMPIVISREVD